MASDSPRIWQARYDRLLGDLRAFEVRLVRKGYRKAAYRIAEVLDALEGIESLPGGWDADLLDSEDE